MRSAKPVFCGRVRALKNPADRFQTLEIREKRSAPVESRPTRPFQLSHTIYAQVYPQVVRCNPPKTHYLVPRREKNPTCRVLHQKPNTNQTPISSAFIASVRLNQTYFRKTKPRMRMATVLEPKTAITVRVLQSVTVTQKDPGSRPKARDRNTSAWKRRPVALPDLSRSGYARPLAGCSASGRNGGHRDGAQTNIENVETTPHANRHNSREPAGYLAAGR